MPRAKQYGGFKLRLPDYGENPYRDVPADFDIDAETDCWRWKWAKDQRGYGRVQRRDIRAGGVAVTRLVMDVPNGAHVLHSKGCYTDCVNPAHLTIGTHKDNMRDCYSDGLNPRLRVTEEQIAQMRERYIAGASQSAIARELGVSQTTVWRYVIGTGGQWREDTDWTRSGD